MHQYDIAIVGAGPAGSTAAAALARAGVSVVVVDRKSEEDEKPCAGGILYRAIRCLPRDIVVPWLGGDVNELILTSGSDFFQRRTPRPLFRTVLRKDFDRALAEQAERYGAQIMMGTNISQVEPDESGVTLSAGSLRIRARAVIGADGTPSTVAYRCGMVRRLDLEPTMVMQVIPRDMEQFRRRVYIDFNTPAGGYAWIFPKDDHLSVGSGGPGVTKEAMINSAECCLERFAGSRCQIISRRFACIPLPSSDISRTSDRIILTGDAAGLVDPFTREGISWAIESGKLAAKAVLGFLNGQSKLQTYENLLERKILPELRAAGGITAWAYEDPARAHRWLRERWYFWLGFCGLLTGQVSHRSMYAGLRIITRIAP